METKKIMIYVTERKSSDGKKFNSYHTFTKNNKRMDVKFRQAVTNLPTSNCMAIIGVDDMNIDKSGRYDVLWVKAVVGYEDMAEAKVEANRQRIDEYFD